MMESNETKDQKYYWLKLKRDFFKRHDIKIIEAMTNGKDYILFYLKLLCESVDHEGNLRFSEEIPYNEEMLATITNTNVDVVRSAITIFEKLKMIEILDNGTYFMREVQKMMGSETYWAERKRIQRTKNAEKNNLIGQCPTCPGKSIDIDTDIDIEVNTQESQKMEEDEVLNIPTLEEIDSFVKENNYKVNPQKFFLHYNAQNWKIGERPIKNWKAVLKAWEFNSKNASSTPTSSKKPDWLIEYEKNFESNWECL